MPAVTCSRGCWHPIDQILSSSVTGNLLVVFISRKDKLDLMLDTPGNFRKTLSMNRL